MNALLSKFNDGGPFFSYPIIILLLVIIGLIIKGAVQKGHQGKTIALLSSLSWFVLAWGFLGRTFGLIMAFDNVQASGELTPHLLAGGLKMAILNPLFAIITFIIARAGILAFIWSAKKESFDEKGKIVR